MLKTIKLFRRRFFFVFFASLFLVFFSSSDGWAAKKKAKKPYVLSARSAIFSDSTRAKRLYGKNVHLKVPPASTTKVMTALIVMERLSLDQVVTVSRHATGVAPSKAGLQTGERYRVSDLLYAALMQSANDATVVLAEAVSGSEAEFTKLMNQEARQLGAKHTRFLNSNGLPTKAAQYTTAYDMYLIFREALQYPFFKDALNQKTRTITSLSGRSIPIKSHNKLLWKDWKKDIRGKTGYTKKAKYCFVGYLENGKNTLIIAVYGCTRRWNDIRYIVTKYGGIKL